MKNHLTFDLEEAFHSSNFDATIARDSWDSLPQRAAANTERILEHLERAGVRATFFVVGWVAERQPELMRRIDAAGHELAAHTYAHRLLYEMSPDEFREDLRRNVGAIESATGRKVFGFRAPSYSVTASSMWALDVLAEEGFLYDSSVYPFGLHPRYGMAGAPLTPYCHSNGLVEFPLPVAKLAGGSLPFGTGAYFRLLPYAVTRACIRRANTQGTPVTVNLHPWEFDPAQPRLPMKRRYRWRHFFNLHRTERRLESLLADFSFGSLSSALAAHAQPIS